MSRIRVGVRFRRRVGAMVGFGFRTMMTIRFRARLSRALCLELGLSAVRLSFRLGVGAGAVVVFGLGFELE